MPAVVITSDQLRRLAPAAKQPIIDAVAKEAAAGVLDAYAINTPLRACHFLSQTAHESDEFKTTVEYASGFAYEGRRDLGNTQPGDGKRFRGHGLIQNTGRANHREFTRWMRQRNPKCPDFEAEPEKVAEFPWALLSALWYWSTRGLNGYADRDDVETITRRINGGLNGFADRKSKLLIAKSIWLISPEAERPILRRVEKRIDDPNVRELQTALNIGGYGPVTVDGWFFDQTDTAVRKFQSANGLLVDGVVGPKTWGALPI